MTLWISSETRTIDKHIANYQITLAHACYWNRSFKALEVLECCGEIPFSLYYLSPSRPAAGSDVHLTATLMERYELNRG